MSADRNITASWVISIMQTHYMIQRSEKNGRRSSSRTWAGLIHTRMPHEQLLCLQADRMANSPPMANLGESLDAVSQGGWKLLC